MGKTVKSRTIASIVSFLAVLTICVVANNSVPQLYESYKQRVVAQQAASQEPEEVKKDQEQQPSKQTSVDAQPAEPADDGMSTDDASVAEDTNTYEIEEDNSADTSVPEEEAPAEEPEESEEGLEDFDFDFDFGESEDKGNTDKGNKESIIDKIISFVKTIIEKISSLDIIGKVKNFFLGIFKLFGIKL